MRIVRCCSSKRQSRRFRKSSYSGQQDLSGQAAELWALLDLLPEGMLSIQVQHTHSTCRESRLYVSEICERDIITSFPAISGLIRYVNTLSKLLCKSTTSQNPGPGPGPWRQVPDPMSGTPVRVRAGPGPDNYGLKMWVKDKPSSGQMGSADFSGLTVFEDTGRCSFRLSGSSLAHRKKRSTSLRGDGTIDNHKPVSDKSLTFT